jgi:hypothetical protein
MIFYILLFGVMGCDFTMDLTKEQNQILCNFGKSGTETLAMIRQAFWKKSMKRRRMFEWLALFRACRISIGNEQRIGSRQDNNKEQAHTRNKRDERA